MRRLGLLLVILAAISLSMSRAPQLHAACSAWTSTGSCSSNNTGACSVTPVNPPYYTQHTGGNQVATETGVATDNAYNIPSGGWCVPAGGGIFGGVYGQVGQIRDLAHSGTNPPNGANSGWLTQPYCPNCNYDPWCGFQYNFTNGATSQEVCAYGTLTAYNTSGAKLFTINNGFTCDYVLAGNNFVLDKGISPTFGAGIFALMPVNGTFQYVVTTINFAALTINGGGMRAYCQEHPHG